MTTSEKTGTNVWSSSAKYQIERFVKYIGLDFLLVNCIKHYFYLLRVTTLYCIIFLHMIGQYFHFSHGLERAHWERHHHPLLLPLAHSPWLLWLWGEQQVAHCYALLFLGSSFHLKGWCFLQPIYVSKFLSIQLITKLFFNQIDLIKYLKNKLAFYL